MTVRDFLPGDMVWSAVELHNDGTLPEVEREAVLAVAGARGVVVKSGSLEHRPEVRVYLVRFEDGGENGGRTLGPPVGCFAEELTQEQPDATAPHAGVSQQAR